MEETETGYVSTQRAVRYVASVFALAAFAVVVVSGIFAQASATRTLVLALFSMVVCQGIGEVIGRIGMHAIRQAVAAHKEANPIPEEIGYEASEEIGELDSPVAGDTSVSIGAESPQIARAA